MKKYIVLIFLIILFGFTYAYRSTLYDLYRTYFVKEDKDVSLNTKNVKMIIQEIIVLIM